MFSGQRHSYFMVSQCVTCSHSLKRTLNTERPAGAILNYITCVTVCAPPVTLLTTRQVGRRPTLSVLPSKDFEYSSEKHTRVKFLLLVPKALSLCVPAAMLLCYYKENGKIRNISHFNPSKPKEKNSHLKNTPLY